MELILVIFGTSFIFTSILTVINSWDRNIEIAVAGNLDEPCNYSDTRKLSPFHVFVYKWKIIIPWFYRVVIAGGPSMVPFGINEGDLVFVKKINSDKKEKLQIGDNILIDVRKITKNITKKEVKFRHLENFHDDGIHIITSTYKNGKKITSKSHSLKNVIGKVEFISM